VDVQGRALRMKWTDTADKKRPEYDVGPALLKLMMQVDERVAFEASGIASKKLTATRSARSPPPSKTTSAA